MITVNYFNVITEKYDKRVAVAKMAWKGNAHKKQRACGTAEVG